MDFEGLLRRYMAYVHEEEGHAVYMPLGDAFTEDERAWLEAVSDELDAAARARFEASFPRRGPPPTLEDVRHAAAERAQAFERIFTAENTLLAQMRERGRLR